MKSFQFTPTPTIIFGIGKRKELPRLIGNYGSHTLIITGGGSFRKSAIGSELLDEIKNNFEYSNFEAVAGEPTSEIIDKIVDKYRQIPLDVIVAIGGGSVLDAGKAISAMIFKNESIVEYLEGVGSRKPDGSKLPFIALPTTSGTGSETTKNAVISKVGINGFKKSLRHDNYIPNIALVDPELTITCSPEITASSGMDAFTQLLEAYVSSKSTDFIDLFAYQGLQLVAKNIKKTFDDGEGIHARASMSYAAMLSGIALANSGLGTVHGFASSIGALYPIPHGVVCGTLMAECVALNVEKLEKTKGEAYAKYVNAGKLFTNKNEQSDDYYCKVLIDSLRGLTEEMKLPKLSAYGIKREDFDAIVLETDNKNNPVELSKADMMHILEERL